MNLLSRIKRIWALSDDEPQNTREVHKLPAGTKFPMIAKEAYPDRVFIKKQGDPVKELINEPMHE